MFVRIVCIAIEAFLLVLVEQLLFMHGRRFVMVFAVCSREVVWKQQKTANCGSRLCQHERDTFLTVLEN